MTGIKRLGKASVKVQTIAALLSLIAAVALPQLLHVIGAVSGLGTALGETFLPMHLPIILTGLIAGPIAGAVSGALAPLVSFLLTGMPTSVMLPFMMVELFCYGLISGLLRDVKLPCTVKVLAAMVTGRLVRAGVILIAVYGFSYQGVSTAVILKSIAVGLPGIILQLVLIPLVIYRINGALDENG